MTGAPATTAARPEIAGAGRVVVKVGSSSLTTLPGGLDVERLTALVDVLAAVRASGREVVLVSSGAIAAGLAPLGIDGRPRDLATAQAAASVGQLRLVQTYADAFARHGITVGQVLLTADDLTRRSHYRNAHRTVERLLSLGVLPIVNENDTVATEEIRFGDNDRLAALVAHVAQAGALVLLSDVDGVYDGDPRTGPAQLVDTVREPGDLAAVSLGSASRNGVGTGGMATKVEAAFIAAHAGVPVVVTSTPQAADALAGNRVGTLFGAMGRRPSARQFWLRYASRPRGRLILDDGAVTAVRERHASLLAAGITGIAGDFLADDPVELVGPDGAVVARGLVAYDAREMPGLLGRKTGDLPPEHRREVVHRDEMVLVGRLR
ncbi:glutamate 5-kinase [Blastococcus saxobsidens]|uniref:Glutamate 5-kinase n=1 Tax=Blastococcus saxobsidens (strain DD2) TaxID=1146883 RepID=H6RLF5_BLASD|nr:glutamate 5-kinase [Blastococcus saxobsidens]CCG02481.1 gamma-glutamate kinase [Blastococcus saxobsidens DD2]